jgi:hypothetical protein
MSISIATKGYFTPATGGTTVIQTTGGGTGFGPSIPPLPIVYIIDVDDKEFEFPFVQITDVENGVNNNE